MKFRGLLIILLLYITSYSYSQVIDQARSDLLVGRIYQDFVIDINEHPYLFENKFYNSNITYKGKIYKDRLIKYDIANQEVILFQKIDTNLPRFIQLNKKYLSEFCINLNNKEVIFTNKFSYLKELPKNIKYYELIYDGKLKYIVGRYKSINGTALQENKLEYDLNEINLIVKNNKVFRIKRKRDLYKIYPYDKKNINAFIKSNKLNITTRNRDQIIEVLKFCETL